MIGDINLLDFILLSFTSYRLARLLVDEQAPFGLAQRLRDMFGASALECLGQFEKDIIVSALCCIHCTGVYTAAFVTLLYSVALHPLPPIEWGLLTLAVAGVTSWLYD